MLSLASLRVPAPVPRPLSVGARRFAGVATAAELVFLDAYLAGDGPPGGIVATAAHYSGLSVSSG